MQSTLISYQVTLIDIGETISMPLYRSEKFLLSQDASLLPPMAILCLVGKVRFHRKHSAILFFFFSQYAPSCRLMECRQIVCSACWARKGFISKLSTYAREFRILLFFLQYVLKQNSTSLETCCK